MAVLRTLSAMDGEFKSHYSDFLIPGSSRSYRTYEDLVLRGRTAVNHIVNHIKKGIGVVDGFNVLYLPNRSYF